MQSGGLVTYTERCDVAVSLSFLARCTEEVPINLGTGVILIIFEKVINLYLGRIHISHDV